MPQAGAVNNVFGGNIEAQQLLCNPHKRMVDPDMLSALEGALPCTEILELRIYPRTHLHSFDDSLGATMI
jgi:hypothetical protein